MIKQTLAKSTRISSIYKGIHERVVIKRSFPSPPPSIKFQFKGSLSPRSGAIIPQLNHRCATTFIRHVCIHRFESNRCPSLSHCMRNVYQLPLIRSFACTPPKLAKRQDSRLLSAVHGLPFSRLHCGSPAQARKRTVETGGGNSPLRRAVTAPDFQNNCLGTRYDLLTHSTVSFLLFFLFIPPSLRLSRVVPPFPPPPPPPPIAAAALLFSTFRFLRFFLLVIIFFPPFFLIGEVVETDLKFNRGIGSAVMCSIALWLVTDGN